MDEVKTLIGILEEIPSIAQTVPELYLNIPVPILDYKDLIANNQADSIA